MPWFFSIGRFLNVDRQELMKCDKCGHEKNEQGAMFCEACGGPLLDGGALPDGMWKCPGCGAPAVGEFCSACGAGRFAAEGEAPSEQMSQASGKSTDSANNKDTDPPAHDVPQPAYSPASDVHNPVEPCIHQQQAPEGKLGEGDLRDVVVEIMTQDEWWVGEDCQLSFRLTNRTQKAFTATISAEVERVRHFQTKSTHDLGPREKEAMFRIGFIADTAGQKKVTNLRLALQAKGDADESKCFRVPDDSIMIRVSAKDSETRPSLHIEGGVRVEAYGSDNVKLLDLGDQKQQQKDHERWQQIRLIFDDEATEALRPKKPVKKEPPVMRQHPIVKGLKAAKLVFTDRDCVRKIFLFAKQSLRIGKDQTGRDGEENDIILRSLHGESRTRTDETLRISRLHGILYLEKDGVFYRDESLNGTEIDQEPLKKNSRSLPEICTMDFAGVLKIKARIFKATTGMQHDSLAQFRPHAAVTDIATGPFGGINAVRLRRQDGAHHEYILLNHRAIIGSNKEDAIWITGDGVEDIHARLKYENDEFLIRSETGESPTLVDGYALKPGEYCTLAPGKIITLGRTKVLFEAILPEDFKTLD